MFQPMAETSMDRTTAMGMTSSATTSWPMVPATATPKRNGPLNSATDARMSATRGLVAPEEIMVATMFELS